MRTSLEISIKRYHLRLVAMRLQLGFAPRSLGLSVELARVATLLCMGKPTCYKFDLGAKNGAHSFYGFVAVNFTCSVDLRTGETKSRVLPTTYTGFMGRSADCSMDPYTKTWRKVPDLLTYTEFFESKTDASQYFTYSFSELAKYFETQHQGESFFGFYKDSSVKGFLSETVAANESAVNSAAASESGYVVELRYTPEMLRFFAQTNQLGFNESSFFQAQALLPETIATDADKQVYHSFIDVYGTHVGQQWLSGGGLATFEMTNMSLIDRKNESWAAKQSGFAIDIIIVAVGWSSAHAHGKANMSADFKSSSYSVMMAVGGNPLLLEAGGPNMLGWNASIPDAPAPFNTTAFINVSQLVVDETRRNNLQAVVDEYLQGGRSVIDPLADLAHSTCAQPPGANLSFSQIPDPKDPTASLLSSGAVQEGPDAGRQYSEEQQRRALHALREPQLHDPCRFDAAADSPGVLHRSVNLTGKKLSELTNTRAMCSAHAAHSALKLHQADGSQATQGSNRLVDRTQEQSMLTVPWPSANEIAEDPNHPAPVPVGAHDSPPSRFLSQELGVGWAFNFTTGTITLPVAAPDSYEWNKTFVNPYTWAWSELPKYSDLTLRPSSCMSERFVMEQNASAVGSFYASETGVFVGFSFDGISAAIGFLSEKADWDLDTKQNEYSRFSLHKELSLWDMSFSSSVWAPGQQSDNRFMPEWLEVQEKYLPDPSDPGAEAAYRRIAHFYGTHVVAGASLGATCRFSVQYKTGFASHVSGHYRSTQFELILGEFVTGLEGSLDLGFNKASFQQQINETFRENTAIDWHCAGGDTNLLDPSNPESYALWLLSIAKQPVVIPTSMRLRPLYMYMQEPAKAMYMKGVIEAMVKESAKQLESEEYRIAGEEIDARRGRRN